MDRRGFDTLVRALGEAAARRTAAGVLLGAAVSALVAGEAAACIKTGKRCRTSKRDKCNLCCSYYDDGTYCRCKPDRKPCGNDLECCSGLCSYTNGKGRCAAG